jgi:hypothetical protein
MTLFNIDTPEAKNALFEFTKQISSDKVLYVEGRNKSLCTTVSVYTEEEYLIYCYEKVNFLCQYTRKPTSNEPGKHHEIEENILTFVYSSFSPSQH